VHFFDQFILLANLNEGLPLHSLSCIQFFIAKLLVSLLLRLPRKGGTLRVSLLSCRFLLQALSSLLKVHHSHLHSLLKEFVLIQGFLLRDLLDRLDESSLQVEHFQALLTHGRRKVFLLGSLGRVDRHMIELVLVYRQLLVLIVIQQFQGRSSPLICGEVVALSSYPFLALPGLLAPQEHWFIMNFLFGQVMRVELRYCILHARCS